MPRPWLSVVMPTYNGARFVRAALDSVVAQRDPDIEVIVVDDGSGDGTPAMVRSYSRGLPLTVVQRPHSGNWVVGTNLGMRLARGEYVSWLHQDDAWCAGRLAVMNSLVRKWPEATLVVHDCWYIDARGRKVGLWRCPMGNGKEQVLGTEVLERLLVQCFIATPAPLIKAEAARRVGELDEDLWYLADWDYWLKLAALGSTLHHPRALALFRIHRGSQTARRLRDTEELRRQHELVLARHLPGWEDRQRRTHSVGPVARYSAELNVALARLASGGRFEARRLIAEFLELGPAGWHRYIRDSRIVERALSRMRTGALYWPRDKVATDASCVAGTPVGAAGG